MKGAALFGRIARKEHGIVINILRDFDIPYTYLQLNHGGFIMKLDKNCALLVIDIQQEDFMEMNESNMDEPRWDCIRNGRRVLDVFRALNLPVIQIKECHRPDMALQARGGARQRAVRRSAGEGR